jgi:Sec-independent protein secretion pathway component TatC
MENDAPQEEKMSLTSHLEELKTRLVRILIAIGIGSGSATSSKTGPSA